MRKCLCTFRTLVPSKLLLDIAPGSLKHLGIKQCRANLLMPCLHESECRHDEIRWHSRLHVLKPWADQIRNSAIPVDEGPVAIEGNCLKASKFDHRSLSLACFSFR